MKVLMIGAGNMGEALLKGILNEALAMPEELYLLDKNEARALAIKERYACQIGVPEEPLDLAILAIKPQDLKNAPDFSELPLEADSLLMSVVAGVTLAQLRTFFEKPYLVRAMPNTPALVSAGAAAFAVEASVPPQAVEIAWRVLSSVGLAVEVEEEQLDAVTAISGSGPAYVFAFLEALEASGRHLGLPQEVASRLARQTLIGAGELLKSQNETAKVLRERVTSKGGTTEAALAVLQKDGQWESMLKEATLAAKKRAILLSSSLDEDEG